MVMECRRPSSGMCNRKLSFWPLPKLVSADTRLQGRLVPCSPISWAKMVASLPAPLTSLV